MTGALVISLDFELLWGVRDHSDKSSPYAQNILGGREAIPQILELFERRAISATWATVGFLFCESKEELIANQAARIPSYSKQSLSNYSYVEEVGENEQLDPYYFAPSLIKVISETPGQEIATHTLSHYYCLEEGQTDEEFEADLEATINLSVAKGHKVKSIVFPRNQFGPQHIEICKKYGITKYRGTPTSWAYRSTTGDKQSRLRRALRLIDAYSGLLGSQAFRLSDRNDGNVPASRFLRPCSGRFRLAHPLHLWVIKREMTRAAKAGQVYHLWWHPHNFGRDTDANIGGLESVLRHYDLLKQRYGFKSLTMGDC